MSPALAGNFFTTDTTWEARCNSVHQQLIQLIRNVGYTKLNYSSSRGGPRNWQDFSGTDESILVEGIFVVVFKSFLFSMGNLNWIT